MLSGLVFIILLVIVLFVLFITRNFARKTGWPVPAIILAVIILISGLPITIYSGNVLESGWQKKGWPVSPGVVIKSEVVGQRAFHPEIT